MMPFKKSKTFVSNNGMNFKAVILELERHALSNDSDFAIGIHAVMKDGSIDRSIGYRSFLCRFKRDEALKRLDAAIEKVKSGQTIHYDY